MNTHSQDDRNMSFIDWLPTFERTQEIQNRQISELTKSVSSLAASVDSLQKQQRALFGKADRPYPWGALVGGLTILVLGAGLLIAPIKLDLNNQHIFDIMTTQHIVDSGSERAKLAESVRWLEKMESRTHTQPRTTPMKLID